MIKNLLRKKSLSHHLESETLDHGGLGLKRVLV